MHEKKTIGIIGGMGPMATADIFYKIIKNTKASCDQEHIHIIIDNYPQIPDRTDAIKNGVSTPVDYLVESANRLINGGADFLIMPCNTSHYFINQVTKRIDCQIVNMITETAKYVKRIGYSKVALFATDGVMLSKVYENTFREYGIELLKPSIEGQKLIMDLIYNKIKAGIIADSSILNDEIADLKSKGAQCFILGCTELPLAFEDEDKEIFIDSSLILAKSAIQMAGYNLMERNY